MNRLLRKLKAEMNLAILFGVALVIILIFALTMWESLYSSRNLKSMAFQIPEFGLLAFGMMLSFLIGGIDLSIVAIANTSGIFAACVLTGRWFPGLDEQIAVLVAVLIAIVSSLIMGIINGIMISKLSAPPLIATLGTMTFYTGIGMALTGGKGVTGLPQLFASFGIAELWGIPIIFLIYLGVAVILALVLGYTSFGRKLYLYGGNPVAARFSAINNEHIVLSVFMITGLLAGIAGLIIISRVNSAKVGYGDAYLLQALLVCVIGGIHPNGGRGKVVGVVCAIVLMQLLSSAFTVWRFSPYAKKLIWGTILIVVMGLNYFSNRHFNRFRIKKNPV